MKANPIYTYGLALLYFAVSAVGIFHHELWLDESHHWLLARDSNSIAELIWNCRSEGHPILWNILLYGISRVTFDPIWMQVLHILISTSVVLLFLKKAPFPWMFKFLFIFGYFMLFEYNLLSRNYILGIFFLFLACSLFEERHRKPVQFFLCLALAANIHLMFAVIAFALFLVVVFESYSYKTIFNTSHLWAYLIFFLGLGIAAFQIIPSSDTLFFTYNQDVPFFEKFGKGFISLFKGLATIPDFSSIHFWNSNFLVNFSKPLAAILGLLAYLIPLILFYRSKMTLFFAYVALIGIQVFFFVTQLGATRYDGVTFITIIIGLWIQKSYLSDDYPLAVAWSKTPLKLLKGPIVFSILFIHFGSGIGAYIMDHKHQFTSAKEANQFLKDKKLYNQLLVSVGCEATALSAYAEKKVWFLCNGGYRSFCQWNSGCKPIEVMENLVPMITEMMQTRERLVFVSNSPLVLNPKPGIWTNLNDDVKVRFHKQFDKEIVRWSGYYIFEVVKIHKKN